MKLAIFRHEWRESWRNKRVLWLPIALALLTGMQPLTLHFLPQILEFGGNLPEGATIEFPRPGSGEVMISVVEQLRQIGLILILLAAMNAFSHERTEGTLAWLRSLRIPSSRIVLSKWAHYALLSGLSITVAYLFSAYYTSLLFENLPLAETMISLSLMIAHVMTQLALFILFAAWFTSGLGAFAVTVSLYLVVSVFLGLDGTFWLPWQLGRLSAEVFVTPVNPTWPLISALVIISLSLYVAARNIRWTNSAR